MANQLRNSRRRPQTGQQRRVARDKSVPSDGLDASSASSTELESFIIPFYCGGRCFKLFSVHPATDTPTHGTIRPLNANCGFGGATAGNRSPTPKRDYFRAR